jgi:hypothetical protein
MADGRRPVFLNLLRWRFALIPVHRPFTVRSPLSVGLAGAYINKPHTFAVY